MTFEYQSKIYLGEVALYVADLARQRDFYQRVLGLMHHITQELAHY